MFIATVRKSDIFLLAILKLQHDCDVSLISCVWRLFSFYQAQHTFSLLLLICSYFIFVVSVVWSFCTCLSHPCLQDLPTLDQSSSLFSRHSSAFQSQLSYWAKKGQSSFFIKCTPCTWLYIRIFSHAQTVTKWQNQQSNNS